MPFANPIKSVELFGLLYNLGNKKACFKLKQAVKFVL